jgi:hypothetical protein
MMSDSRRLLSTTGYEHEIERSLLRGLRDVAAPPDAKAETWTRLQAQLAFTAAVAVGAAAAQSASTAALAGTAEAGAASAPTGLAASTALRSVAIKLGLGVLVASAMTVAAVALWPRGMPTMTSRMIVPAPSVPIPAVTPLNPDPRTLPVPVTDDPGANPTVRPESKPIHPRRPEPTVMPDPLSVEAAMITEARAQLRRGDARAALATLGRLESRSRNGALGQEREILTIQALSALGETEDARRRARAFVASHPDSPHVAQIRGIAPSP